MKKKYIIELEEGQFEATKIACKLLVSSPHECFDNSSLNLLIKSIALGNEFNPVVNQDIMDESIYKLIKGYSEHGTRQQRKMAGEVMNLYRDLWYEKRGVRKMNPPKEKPIIPVQRFDPFDTPHTITEFGEIEGARTIAIRSDEMRRYPPFGVEYFVFNLKQ